jgi:hypothetical protein
MLPPLPPYPATDAFSVRVGYILNAMMVYLASRVVREKPSLPLGIRVPVRIENLINGWLLYRRRAIMALIRRIEAGTQKAPRPYRARPPTPRGANPAPRKPAKPPRPWHVPGLRMPLRFGWISPFGGEIAAMGHWLGPLLGEAAMRAMVLAHPRLAALLRPVLRMVGLEAPDWFPRPAKRARAKPPPPVRPILPPPRPTHRRFRTPASWRRRPVDPTPKDPPPDTPTRELARYAARVRAHHEEVLRQHLFPGWIWIDGRPAIPPPREDCAPPPPPSVPPPAPRRIVVRMWDGRVIPVRDRWSL